MLIHKRNFLGFKLFIACMALLLGCQARAAVRAPDTVAAAFYGWYLDTLAADQDPLSDRYDTFTGYVARDLAARLVERLKSGGAPAADYFIQAADYRQAWRGSVRALVLRQRGGTAEVRVTLGQDVRSQRVLKLGMVLENGAWKIRSVALAEDDFFGTSADPPAS